MMEIPEAWNAREYFKMKGTWSYSNLRQRAGQRGMQIFSTLAMSDYSTQATSEEEDEEGASSVGWATQ